MRKALQILHHANRPNKVVSRDTVVFSKLMALLDHPHRAFKSIHVTGTNGKGSVSLKVASVFQNAGIKTGLYTSPHLFSFRERIQVNQKTIEEGYFVDKILMLHQLTGKNKIEITFFEYLTAVGFMYFRDSKCEVAAIEVGLGGRFDTTNVISPALSIITSIGIDHARLLGDTKEKIAQDKAGIIKQNTPVVLGPQASYQCILQQALQKNAPVYKVQGLHSDFEHENNSVVKQSFRVLNLTGFNVSDNSVSQGCKAQQPCRMQELPAKLMPKGIKSKQIVFDVGHNPAAIVKAMEYYRKNLKKSKTHCLGIIFGASKEKQIIESLTVMQEESQSIALVSANHYRAMPIQKMEEAVGQSAKPWFCRIYNKGNIESTLNAMTFESFDTLLICGSFFMMPECWGYFDESYLCVQANLNEQYELVKP